MEPFHISTISIMPFGMVNSFVLASGPAVMLIDTGLPGSEARIEKGLARLGKGWGDVSLIVLTHAHIDHAGSAARIRALTGAPVLAHQEEVALCLGQAPVLRPTRLFGRLFQKTGLIQRPFDPIQPDIVMQGEAMELNDRGFAARILHTPGHTPGSVSVLFENGVVFAGDLAASGILLGGIALRSRPARPPFEESPADVAQSLDMLLDLGGHTFHLGHGGPLGRDTIAAHSRRLRALPRR